MEKSTAQSLSSQVSSSSQMPEPNGLPRSALYLALAEVFMSVGVWLNNRALMVNLFGIAPEQTLLLNLAFGVVIATFLTCLLSTDWTVCCLLLCTGFHVLLLVWMNLPSATCQFCRYMAPTLAMFSATLEPIRLAFISDQLTSADPSYVRPYLIFMAGSWFFGFVIVQLVTYFLEGPTMAATVSGTVLTIFILYTALVIFIQTNTPENRVRYYKTCHVGAVQIYRTHEGKKYWEIFHIGVTMTGHYTAQLVLIMAQKEQFRSIKYAGNLSGIVQSVVSGLPAVLAVVIIIIMAFVVTPFLKRYNKEVTDLQYIGLGMIFGCVAMALALIIQTYIDRELKPPRRQESVLFLFNLLPSNTTFKSKVFGYRDSDFIQVGGTSVTAFLSKNVTSVDEYAISVINSVEKMFEETFIKLIEGTTVSYIVTRGNFVSVSGLDLQEYHFLDQDSVLFLGCAVNSSTCDGKRIEFSSEQLNQPNTLPPKEKFKAVFLPGGNYTIVANVDGEDTTLVSNLMLRSIEMHAGIVYEKEPGLPDIAVLPIKKPETFPSWLYIVQQIMIAFKDGFFTIGLLRFLYYQTRPNHPARPFVYSTFFFIYKGIPMIIMGGLRTSIFNFLETFVVIVSLSYYACCTALFINLANKFENFKWFKKDNQA